MNTERTIADLTVNEFKALMTDVVMKANSINQWDRLLRLKQVLEIYPVSKSHWYEGVQSGKYPQSVKLSDGITAWRESEIQNLIKEAK